MQTKIVLTGSFSVGKTTLLQFFKDQAHIVPEVAYDFLSQNPELQSQPEFQQLVLKEQIRREEKAKGSKFPLIICDRGVIDVVCFSRYFEHPEPRVDFHYDGIFLCSPENVPCIYGTEAEKMRHNLHKIFLEVFHERQLPYVILEGGPEERYERIQQELLIMGKEGNVRSWYERR